MRFERGIQYGLRGLDPFTGKDLPYEVKTPQGPITKTQQSVDEEIFAAHIKKEIAEMLENIWEAKSKTKMGRVVLSNR